MAKALQVLVVLGVLLLLDAVIPRADWMPAPLVTRSAIVEARWWPFSEPPAKVATVDLIADSSWDDSSDDVEDSNSAQPVASVVAPAVARPERQKIAIAQKPKPIVRPQPKKPTPSVDEVLANSFVAPASAHWDDFGQRLSELEAGGRTKVRVVQLGDSEIAGDWVSRTLRKQFSKRYGPGGLGFALAMAPWPWYAREGYKLDDPDGFSVKSFVFGKSSDGNYGPGGIAFDSTRKGATASVALSFKGSGIVADDGCEVAFHYGTAPGGGTVEIEAGGAKIDTIDTAAPNRSPEVHRYKLDTCPSSLSATVTTSERVRIFGWSLESGTPGIVWSSLGVVSATSSQLQHYGAEQLTQALKNLRPDLVILGYGLNIVHSGVPPPSSERSNFKSILAEVHDAMPDTRCLALSPYPVVVSNDGTLAPSPAVSVLARYQRDAASEVGCAFLDRELMSGGPASGLKWLDAKPRILSGDYVHLTETGSERMGRQMARVLLDQKPEAL